jgi:pyridoxine kinase
MTGVIVLNSQVAHGSVGGRASNYTLERAGFPVVLLPTVLYAWHPGHGPSTRDVPAGFDQLVADLATAPWLSEIDGVLTGYLGNAGQPAVIGALVDALKAANPQALYLCDPVIGDQGGLYVPATTAAAIRRDLLPRADIVTPNAHELAWLAEMKVDDAATVEAAAARLGVREVLVTSVPGGPEGTTGVALISPDERALARHDMIAGVPSGSGDVFAGLYLSQRLKNVSARGALEKAVHGTAAMALAASALGVDEMPLAQFTDDLASAHEPSVQIE